ncbi:MAG: DUF2905 domain-containing protein [Lewinellaceae bacterium]|nr:DUF2905 domain-containing protein [Lewinellaceae bacterium]
MEFSTNSLPKLLLAAGALLIVLGLLTWALQDKLSWLGRLPGDIRIERENFNLYIPVTTMILLSVVLSGLLWLARRMWPGG